MREANTITEDQVRGATTLTSQMCPMGPQILAAGEMAVRRVPGVKNA